MSRRRLLITTGDVDGIGTEIAAKALKLLTLEKKFQVILWRSPECPPQHLRLIKAKYSPVTVTDLRSAFAPELRQYPLVDIKSKLQPAHWVELSAKACISGQASALITGPLSKTSLVESGFQCLGHTGLFRQLCKTNDLFMGFLGRHFNVLLASDHIPLRSVPEAINVDLLEKVLKAAYELQSMLPKKNARKPIAFLGLNPHSGEEGLIGLEEQLIFSKFLQRKRGSQVRLQGPLVPDAAFLKKNWSRYSLYVGLYHDQGLIPFKLVHGQDSGTHVTLGLPFIRTSVDHGCAKDLFGKNKANPNSMLEAIQWAVRLVNKKGA